MGEWAPTTFEQFVSRIDRRLGKQNRNVSAAAGMAAEAVETATGAMQSANGKNTLYWLPEEPTGEHVIGDTWFDTSNDNAINTWDGEAWVPLPLGENAIADLAITDAKIANLDAAKIVTGFLDTDRLRANSITSALLAVGDFKDWIPGSDFEVAAKIPWNFPDANATLDGSTRHAGNYSMQFATTGEYTPPPTTTTTTTAKNLSTNPKAKTATTSWVNLNNAGRLLERIALASADQYLGCATAMRLYPGSGGTAGYRLRHLVAVTGGSTVSLSLGARVNLQKDMTVLVSFNDSSGSEEGTKTRYQAPTATQSANTWRGWKLENLQVPAGAVQMAVDIYSPSGGWSSNSQYILATAVQVNLGATALPYFDGDTAGTTTDDGTTKIVSSYAWDGTNGLSTSTRTLVTTVVGDAPAQPTREYQSSVVIPVLPGQPFVLGAWAYGAGQYNGSVNALLELRDDDTGIPIASSSLGRGVLPGEGVWTRITASGTVPDGTTKIRAFVRLDHTRGTLNLDDMYVKNGAGVLIEQGGITTPMIRAGAVVAESLAVNAVQTENLDADAITSKHTITGALIRTSEDGARTEMNAAGLRVVGDDGNDLVRLGYGIANGMAVRDPNSAQMIPLANMAFGTKYLPVSGGTASFAVPVGAENAWGGYSTEVQGDWIAPSNRVMWMFFALTDQASQQNFRVQAQAYLVDSTDTSVGARVVLTNELNISWTSGFVMGVKAVVQGRKYELRNSYRSYRTFSAPASPPAYVVQRLNILMPV